MKKKRKLNEELAEIAKKEALLHDHEYDPDCKFCSDNKFVREANLAVASKEVGSIRATKHSALILHSVKSLRCIHPTNGTFTRISGMITKA